MDFQTVFHRNIAIFPYYIYFFRVFQNFMLKITPPFTFYIIHIHYLCASSQQHYGYLRTHFTLAAD